MKTHLLTSLCFSQNNIHIFSLFKFELASMPDPGGAHASRPRQHHRRCPTQEAQGGLGLKVSLLLLLNFSTYLPKIAFNSLIFSSIFLCVIFYYPYSFLPLRFYHKLFKIFIFIILQSWVWQKAQMFHSLILFLAFFSALFSASLQLSLII